MCVTVKRVCADLLDDDGRRERRGACGFGDVAHHKVQGRVVVTRKQHLCRVLELFRIWCGHANRRKTNMQLSEKLRKKEHEKKEEETNTKRDMHVTLALV